MEKTKKEKRVRKPIDKRKLITNIVIIVIVVAMVVSAGASLIYSLLAA